MHSKQHQRIVGMPFNRPTTLQQQHCHLNTNLKLCNKPETKGDLPEELQQYLEEGTKWAGSGPQTVSHCMALNYKPIANAAQQRTAEHCIGLLVTITTRSWQTCRIAGRQQMRWLLREVGRWLKGNETKLKEAKSVCVGVIGTEGSPKSESHFAPFLAQSSKPAVFAHFAHSRRTAFAAHLRGHLQVNNFCATCMK